MYFSESDGHERDLDYRKFTYSLKSIISTEPYFRYFYVRIPYYSHSFHEGNNKMGIALASRIKANRPTNAKINKFIQLHLALALCSSQMHFLSLSSCYIISCKSNILVRETISYDIVCTVSSTSPLIHTSFSHFIYSDHLGISTFQYCLSSL